MIREEGGGFMLEISQAKFPKGVAVARFRGSSPPNNYEIRNVSNHIPILEYIQHENLIRDFLVALNTTPAF